VDHSQILSHYRAAHDIAERGALGHADTEDLRQAVVSSRVIFTELVEKLEPVEMPATVEAVTATPELVAVR